MIDPVQHLFLGKVFIVYWIVMRTSSIVLDNPVIELVKVERIRQRPFDNMVVCFDLLCVERVLRLISQCRLRHATHQAWQIKRIDQLLMYR